MNDGSNIVPNKISFYICNGANDCIVKNACPHGIEHREISHGELRCTDKLLGCSNSNDSSCYCVKVNDGE